MGIFDSYKLTNSTGVRQFAGSIVPELAAAKKDLEERYFANQDFLLKAAEAANTVEVRDVDRETLMQTQQEINQKIDEWSSRGDLENATQDVYNLARKSGVKLKNLAQARKAENDFIAGMEKAGYTPKEQEYFKSKLNANGPLQFGTNGQVLNPIQLPTPAAKVDYTDEIKKKVLDVVKASGYGNLPEGLSAKEVEIASDPGNPNNTMIKWGDHTVAIRPEDLAAAFDQLYASDPRMQASLRQDAEVEAYHKLKGTPDEVLQARLETSQDEVDKRAREIMNTNRLPLREAYEQAYRETEENNLKTSLKNYAKTGAYSTHQKTYSETLTPSGYGSGAQGGRGSTGSDGVTPGLDGSTVYFQQGNTFNFEGERASSLSQALTSTREGLTATSNKLSKLRTEILKPGADKIDLEAQIRAAEKQEKMFKSQLEMFTQGRLKQLNDVSWEKEKTSWDNLEKTLNAKNVEALTKYLRLPADSKKTVPILVGRGYTDKAEKYDKQDIPMDQLLEIVKEMSRLSGTIAIAESDGTGGVWLSNPEKHLHYKIPSLPGRNVHDLENQIRENLNTVKHLTEAADKIPVTSIRTTNMTIPSNQMPAVKQLVQGATLRDAAFSKVLSEDPDYRANIDWDKSSVGAYVPEIDAVTVNLAKQDGTTETVLAEMNSNFYTSVGIMTAKSPDPVDDIPGSVIARGVLPEYHRKLGTSLAPLTTHPLTDKPLVAPLEPGGRDYQIAVKKDSQGTYSVYGVTADGRPGEKDGKIQYVQMLDINQLRNKYDQLVVEYLKTMKPADAQKAAMEQAKKESMVPATGMDLMQTTIFLEQLKK